MTVSVGSQAVVDDALFADYKPTSAFLFPGRTSSWNGKRSAECACCGRIVQEALIFYVCINGPKEKLDSTAISQPAIYVTSLAAVELRRARDGGQQIIDSVDFTCGLSFGEYTALAFAGASALRMDSSWSN